MAFISVGVYDIKHKCEQQSISKWTLHYRFTFRRVGIETVCCDVLTIETSTISLIEIQPFFITYCYNVN